MGATTLWRILSWLPDYEVSEDGALRLAIDIEDAVEAAGGKRGSIA